LTEEEGEKRGRRREEEGLTRSREGREEEKKKGRRGGGEGLTRSRKTAKEGRSADTIFPLRVFAPSRAISLRRPDRSLAGLTRSREGREEGKKKGSREAAKPRRKVCR
jgi:hypothetical protein